jgi:hypothetical protein
MTVTSLEHVVLVVTAFEREIRNAWAELVDVVESDAPGTPLQYRREAKV